MVPDIIAETAIQSIEKMRKDGKMWVWTSVTRPHMAAKLRVSRCHMTFNVQPPRQPNQSFLTRIYSPQELLRGTKIRRLAKKLWSSKDDADSGNPDIGGVHHDAQETTRSTMVPT